MVKLCFKYNRKSHLDLILLEDVPSMLKAPQFYFYLLKVKNHKNRGA